MWSQFTNVTDRRTDRQTTCDRNTALCTKVHRAVKTSTQLGRCCWVGKTNLRATEQLEKFNVRRGSVDHRLFTKICVSSATRKGALNSWLKRTACTRYFGYAVWDDNVLTSLPTWQLKHANSILEPSEYFCRISSKVIHIISSYTVSKLGRFLRHSVETILQYALLSMHDWPRDQQSRPSYIDITKLECYRQSTISAMYTTLFIQTTVDTFLQRNKIRYSDFYCQKHIPNSSAAAEVRSRLRQPAICLHCIRVNDTVASGWNSIVLNLPS